MPMHRNLCSNALTIRSRYQHTLLALRASTGRAKSPFTQSSIRNVSRIRRIFNDRPKRREAKPPKPSLEEDSLHRDNRCVQGSLVTRVPGRVVGRFLFPDVALDSLSVSHGKTSLSLTLETIDVVLA